MHLVLLGILTKRQKGEISLGICFGSSFMVLSNGLHELNYYYSFFTVGPLTLQQSSLPVFPHKRQDG
jgi:hypothetical protein